MPPTIRLQHGLCRVIHKNPSEITITLIPNQIGSFYTFLCSDCNELITKSASPRITDILIDQCNVQFEIEERPNQLTEQDFRNFSKNIKNALETRRDP